MTFSLKLVDQDQTCRYQCSRNQHTQRNQNYQIAPERIYVKEFHVGFHNHNRRY